MDIGRVLAIEEERELVGRLDADHRHTRAPASFDRDEISIHIFILQEMANVFADGVVADGGESDGAQTEPARADRDVDGAAADAGLEAGDVVEFRANIEGEEVHRHPAGRDQIDRHARPSS